MLLAFAVSEANQCDSLSGDSGQVFLEYKLTTALSKNKKLNLPEAKKTPQKKVPSLPVSLYSLPADPSP